MFKGVLDSLNYSQCNMIMTSTFNLYDFPGGGGGGGGGVGTIYPGGQSLASFPGLLSRFLLQ